MNAISHQILNRDLEKIFQSRITPDLDEKNKIIVVGETCYFYDDANELKADFAALILYLESEEIN